jgi:NAD(P)-dependent dehydrogenase (short-subunit alcohol dehydrogenase family)
MVVVKEESDMAGEVAIVVGVGPGLGSSLVRCFAGDGMTVVAAARHASERAQFKAMTNIRPVDCDATSPGEVARLFDQTESTLAPPALVVFNVGAYQRGTVSETDPAEFERCWRVGCFSGFLVGREAARRMIGAGQGTIIFTGATASLRGGAGFVNLASPKFALRAVAQSMARELGPKGIHVAHVIIDGQIRSPRYDALLAERGPDSLLEPDEIARSYLMLHRQQRSAWTFELDLRPWVERF